MNVMLQELLTEWQKLLQRFTGAVNLACIAALRFHLVPPSEENFMLQQRRRVLADTAFDRQRRAVALLSTAEAGKTTWCCCSCTCSSSHPVFLR